jgi:hypothetical protein
MDKFTKVVVGLFVFSVCGLLLIPMLFLTYCAGWFLWGMVMG